MSSTNKTTYYELPQFVENDIFNPLVDDNYAYEKIDTALHNIANAEADDAAEIVSIKSRLDSAEGDIDALEAQNGSDVLTTVAQTLSGAVNELKSGEDSLDGRLDVVEDDINNVSTGLKAKVAALETQNGSEVLDTTAQTLSGAINEIKTTISNIVNVKSFGAVGDGVTDNADAFEAAIDALYTANKTGGVLFVPAGIYLFSREVNLYRNQNYDYDMEEANTIGYSNHEGITANIIIIGDTRDNTILRSSGNHSIFKTSSAEPHALQNFTFKDVMFDGNNVAPTSFNFTNTAQTRDCEFYNCSFNRFTEAGFKYISTVALGEQMKLSFNYCRFGDNGAGVIICGDLAMFNGCRMEYNTYYGVVVGDPDKVRTGHIISFKDCIIQYNARNYSDNPAYAQVAFKGGSRDVSFTNCYFEYKTSVSEPREDAIITFTDCTANRVTIDKCYFGLMECIAPMYRGALGIVDSLSVINSIIRNYSTSNTTPVLLYVPDSVNDGYSRSINEMNNAFYQRGDIHLNAVGLTNKGGYQAPNNSLSSGVLTFKQKEDFGGRQLCIIGGTFTANAVRLMKEFGDFTVTKDADNVGVFHVAFGRASDSYGGAAYSYPVYAHCTLANPAYAVKIDNRSAAGFDIITGSIANDTFTPSYQPFEFVAFYSCL